MNNRKNKTKLTTNAVKTDNTFLRTIILIELKFYTSTNDCSRPSGNVYAPPPYRLGNTVLSESQSEIDSKDRRAVAVSYIIGIIPNYWKNSKRFDSRWKKKTVVWSGDGRPIYISRALPSVRQTSGKVFRLSCAPPPAEIARTFPSRLRGLLECSRKSSGGDHF